MDLKEPCSMHAHCRIEYGNGYNKATKAAEPLLKEIEKQKQALIEAKKHIDVICQWTRAGPTQADKTQNQIEEALTSSSLVVAEYRKNTLGE